MAPDPSYLWINKDQKNIKDRQYDFQIKSFVQKQRRVHREKRSLKLGASTKGKHLEWGFREVGTVIGRREQKVCAVPESDVDFEDPYESFDGDKVLILRGREFLQPGPLPHEQVCVFPSEDHLDPFLRLAGKITSRDRALLHDYLTTTPAAVYGMSLHASDCIVRDQTIKFVQMNNTWLHWVLLPADWNRLGPVAAETSPRILARKTFLYREMYKMVTDAKTRHSDITITALGFAAWAEARSSSLARAMNHLLGVTHLVQGRGGLMRLPLMIRSPIPYPFIWMGIGGRAFPSVRALEYAIASFLWLMESMQGLHAQLLQDMMRSNTGVPRGHQRSLKMYSRARREAFGPLATLRPFLQVPFFDSANRIQVRSHVALLWMLNRAMWELYDDLDECSDFLKELDRRGTTSDPSAQCPNNTVICPLNVVEMRNLAQTRRKSTLKTHAIVHIFTMCSMTVNWPPARYTAPVLTGLRDAPVVRWYDTTEEVDENLATPSVIRLSETADVVELLQLLSPESMQQVLHQLSAWLQVDVHTVESSEDPILSRAELTEIADEIRCAWAKCRQDSV
jgi:hypothetical protein